MSDLTVLKESTVCRIALGHSDDGAAALEVLLRLMPPGEVDITALERALALLRHLKYDGFCLTFQDEGWISCEKACPPPSDGLLRDLMAALDHAGFS